MLRGSSNCHVTYSRYLLTLLTKCISCLFVSVGVRGKPRMYCSLLAYCTARFGRSNCGHQVPPVPTDAFHTSGGSWNLWAGTRTGNFA
jgi:hypothetical protein